MSTLGQLLIKKNELEQKILSLKGNREEDNYVDGVNILNQSIRILENTDAEISREREAIERKKENRGAVEKALWIFKCIRYRGMEFEFSGRIEAGKMKIVINSPVDREDLEALAKLGFVFRDGELKKYL